MREIRLSSWESITSFHQGVARKKVSVFHYPQGAFSVKDNRKQPLKIFACDWEWKRFAILPIQN
jgi:hypothetical protein